LSLQVLTKRKWRDSSGQWQEFSNYFNVNILGPQAEHIAKHAAAGQGLYVRANVRMKISPQGDAYGLLEAQSAKLINKASSVNWNQAHISGSLVSHTALVQTINGQDLLTMTVNISDCLDKEQHIDVKLKGAAAKLVSSQLSAHPSEKMSVLVEGSLSSQSKKVADEFAHQYWVDGHTCVLSQI